MKTLLFQFIGIRSGLMCIIWMCISSMRSSLKGFSLMSFSLIRSTLINTARMRFALMLLSVAGLLSCGRVAYPKAATPVPITSTADLDGIYLNSPADSSARPQSLWSVLTRRPGRKPDPSALIHPGTTGFTYDHDSLGQPRFLGYRSSLNYSVQLKSTGKRKIIARLYHDSTLVGKRKLKGKVADNLFRSNTRTRSVGVPFIYWRLSHYGLRFRTDSTRQLLVDIADSNGGMVFIFSGGSTAFSTAGYQRKL